ncbi:MAG: hypothetical protein ACI9MB_004098, partial [Verrucomicrobiales bacterium]
NHGAAAGTTGFLDDAITGEPAHAPALVRPSANVIARSCFFITILFFKINWFV